MSPSYFKDKESITFELGNIALYAVPESSGVISKNVLFANLLLSNCDCGRQFDLYAAWDTVPELPDAKRGTGSISVVPSCSLLLIELAGARQNYIYMRNS